MRHHRGTYSIQGPRADLAAEGGRVVGALGLVDGGQLAVAVLGLGQLLLPLLQARTQLGHLQRYTQLSA